MNRLQQYYKDSVIKDLTEKFSYGSVMQVPRITKITINMGLGEAVTNKKILKMLCPILRKYLVKRQ